MNSKRYCDMHIHTNHSDGLLSVEEVLNHATEKNLFKISITDHDSVDVYFEIQKKKLNQKYKGQILVGCEFVCCVNNAPIEILGYGFDYKKMKKYLDKFGVPQSRLDVIQCQDVVKACKMLGFDIDFDYDSAYPDLIDPNKYILLYNEIMQNKKIYNAFKKIDEALVENFSKFMRLGLNNPKSKICQDHSMYPDATQIIKQIHACGGLSFLAHPFHYGELSEMVLETLKNQVDGIECYHYTTVENGKYKILLDFCKKNKLLVSGGSDFHHNPENINRFKIPEKVFDKIVQEVDNINKKGEQK